MHYTQLARSLQRSHTAALKLHVSRLKAWRHTDCHAAYSGLLCRYTVWGL
jgi:hypothetical protein